MCHNLSVKKCKCPPPHMFPATTTTTICACSPHTATTLTRLFKTEGGVSVKLSRASQLAKGSISITEWQTLIHVDDMMTHHVQLRHMYINELFASALVAPAWWTFTHAWEMRVDVMTTGWEDKINDPILMTDLIWKIPYRYPFRAAMIRFLMSIDKQSPPCHPNKHLEVRYVKHHHSRCNQREPFATRIFIPPNPSSLYLQWQWTLAFLNLSPPSPPSSPRTFPYWSKIKIK